MSHRDYALSAGQEPARPCKQSRSDRIKFLLVTLVALLVVPGAGFAKPPKMQHLKREKQERSAAIRRLSDVHVGRSKKELKQQIAFSGYIVQFFKEPKNHWKLLPRHATCWSHVPSVTLRKVCNYARGKYKAHRWLLETAQSKYERLYAPKPTYVGISSSSLYDAFMCIHKHEGAWNANTGNGYYGGLQMDLAFQGLYGSDYVKLWGTADNWPAAAQIEVAIRAYHSGRGFYPWPNTARACGLI